jgi:tRNA (Thr-GGU) A37 N-methylase
LSYTATDNNGEGKKTIVNLRITVADANDNPPVFDKKNYAATIDEGKDSFEPGKNSDFVENHGVDVMIQSTLL